jgi:hypothetical protein
MTESMPTIEQFGDPEDRDIVEEFRPADQADPEEPETIEDDEQIEMAALGEADPADVAEQEVVVTEDEDDYQRDE